MLCKGCSEAGGLKLDLGNLAQSWGDSSAGRVSCNPSVLGTWKQGDPWASVAGQLSLKTFSLRS